MCSTFIMTSNCCMVIIGFAFVVSLICEFLWAGQSLTCHFVICYHCLVHHKLLENVGWSKSNRAVTRSHYTVSHFVDLCSNMQLCCAIIIYLLWEEKKNEQHYFRQIAGSSNHILFFHWDKGKIYWTESSYINFLYLRGKSIFKIFQKSVRKIKPLCNVILLKIMPKGTAVLENNKSNRG